MTNAGARAALTCLFVSALWFPEPATAQPAPQPQNEPLHTKFFRDQPWYDPLRAEPHEGKVQLLIPAWAKEFPQSMEPGTRFSWQITLGREIPIFAVSPQSSDVKLDPKKWGLGLWTPVHFHVIEDFKDHRRPSSTPITASGRW